MLSSEKLDGLLEGIASALASDGFRLEVRQVGSGLQVGVHADSEACMECAVPASVLRQMICEALDRAYALEEISIVNLTGKQDG